MTWRRVRWYADLLGFALCGVLFGYELAMGNWVFGLPSVGVFIGGASYATRHYLSN